MALLAAVHKTVVEHRVRIADVTALLKRSKSTGNTDNVKSKSTSIKTRILKWIRANVFIPDPKVLWLRPVLLKAIKLCRQENYDVIYTNGTPHSLHLIGRRLQEHYGQTWVADFRDPWTGIDYFEHLPLSSRAIRKHKSLEKDVITNADRVITVSKTWADELGRIGERRVDYIPNGYDQLIDRQDSEGFTLSHIGTLHGDRDLQPIVTALNQLNLNREVRLQLIGSVDKASIESLEVNVKQITIETPGEIEHHLAKQEMAKSSLLLLPINQSKDSQGRIPAKLFEYLTTGIPILCLGDPNGDAAQIIAEVSAGRTFGYDEVSDIQDFISSVENGTYQLSTNMDVVSQYSREKLSIKLEDLLYELIEKKRSHTA